MCNEQDEFYMRRALALAEKGAGWVNPNPMVGAVIVKDGKILGEGYHAAFGSWHAERNALAACTASPAGATLYVTLEPCCHHGKTSPCTEAILQHQIRRVVVGAYDPNPLVQGKGIAQLKAAGVQVETGVLQKECEALNQVFFHYIKTKLPYVVMKYAMTADGKIATVTGASRWITGEQARAHVQETRHRLQGIMVGIQTVLQDDPMLTCRLPHGRNPIRIICDSCLRLPLDCRIAQTAQKVPTIIATVCQDMAKQKALTDLGMQVMMTKAEQGRVCLPELMQQLGAAGIDSILLEGGAELNAGALAAGIVNRVQIYLAPKLFGGSRCV